MTTVVRSYRLVLDAILLVLVFLSSTIRCCNCITISRPVPTTTIGDDDDNDNEEEDPIDKILRNITLAAAAKADQSSSNVISSSFHGVEKRYIETYQQYAPSVALITVLQQNKYKNTWVEITAGTGFMWGNEKQYVVTAHHLFWESDNDSNYKKWKKNEKKRMLDTSFLDIYVTFNGLDINYEAKFVDGDEDNDIAVLELILNDTVTNKNIDTQCTTKKIFPGFYVSIEKDVINENQTITNDGNNNNNDDIVAIAATKRLLPEPIPLGTSMDLQVGQSAIVIGGVDNGCDGGTMGTGIISGVRWTENRDTLKGINGGIIISGGPNQNGMSGSPLLDSNSKLIGMTVGGGNDDSTALVIATPVDAIRTVVNRIIHNGEFFNIRIGFYGIWTDKNTRKYRAGLPSRRKNRAYVPCGFLINEIIPRSPADFASLLLKDGATTSKDLDYDVLVIGVDGILFNRPGDLKIILNSKNENESVDLILFKFSHALVGNKVHDESIEVTTVQLTNENNLEKNTNIFDTIRNYRKRQKVAEENIVEF